MATNPPTLSRTIAILLPHAFDHRTAIVKRFREAGFEIKDEFAWDADPVVLEMDLGVTDEGVKRAFVGDEDETGGAHGGEEKSRRPCHVWCLERRRVVEVMTALVVRSLSFLDRGGSELIHCLGFGSTGKRKHPTREGQRAHDVRSLSSIPSF